MSSASRPTRGSAELIAGPRLEVEVGFGRPRRSRVERDGAIQRGVAEEERQADRDLQRLPRRGDQARSREMTGTGREPRGSAAARGCR